MKNVEFFSVLFFRFLHMNLGEVMWAVVFEVK